MFCVRYGGGEGEAGPEKRTEVVPKRVKLARTGGGALARAPVTPRCQVPVSITAVKGHAFFP